MKKLAMVGIFVAVFIMAFTLSASATAIPVTNNSFEDPPLGDGVWNSAITGWSITGGTAGVWNPLVGQTIAPDVDPSPAFVSNIPEGSQVAYSNGGDIMQTLSANVTEGYKYTLKVHVGGRNAIYSGKPYAVILAGGAAVLSQQTGNNVADSWFEVTRTYTANPGDPNIGQPLAIKLMNDDGVQLNFDKVTLDEAYVLTCQGFLPPFDKPLTLKKKDNRAIPVKMVLKDFFGNIITDANIPGAPPVVQVTFGNEPPPFLGYNDELVPPGLSDDGNAFRYDQADQKWILNLATKQFTASGTYTVTVKAGDASYVIDPVCSQTFTRLP